MSLALFASFSGVDVSEGRLDVHLLPDGSSTSFAHSAAGIGRLVAWLASRERPLVGIHGNFRTSTRAHAREIKRAKAVAAQALARTRDGSP